ncbi:diadenylate cyclase [Paenibacillus sp. FSL P4-0176]|uniref:tetratricopeptide repeat protein n=1 Tax=Paenibacillus sp. FSL P4-0176 TaxID=2921631 RepID=UPI0030D1937A
MVEIERFNKTVYKNLEQIFLKLDNRLDLKLHAVVLDKHKKFNKTMRVKSVLSDEEGQAPEVIEEILTGLKELAEKVGFSNDEWANTDDGILQFLCNTNTTDINEIYSELNIVNTDITEDQELEGGTAVTIKQYKKYMSEWNLLYTNYFDVKVDDEKFTIQYILSIECMDSSIRNIFLEKSQLSFLRMVLDYYYIDYFQLNEYKELNLNNNTELENQYKENHVQFLQRMARIFFGKVQDFISKGSNLNDVENEDEDLSKIVTNQYYINNLLEKIDGISTRTYEGENPFGCMLILKPNLLNDGNLINYSIRFENDQSINFEDARRIRKLLELTNNENDLYLIADDEVIYGIGEINWNQIKDNLVFKIEFKGISKYDLLLVTVKEQQNSGTRVVVEKEAKVFKMTASLEIVSSKLCSIVFKQPGIGSGEFTSELFERTMKTEFKGENPEVTEEQIEKLRIVIKKATEQQSGTMVVITSVKTAEDELKKLKKQSTAIIPTEIRPEFIKHLTSIDGAIYFDTMGKCHAIGVILDGLAHENLGDASRGARFHSAYRYLEKLKKHEKGKKACVIAIISEDGMVNLIPEQANELIVRQLVREMIELIKKKGENEKTSIEQEILEYEGRLEVIADEKDIDHHHYFKIAEAYNINLLYSEASKYYKKGLTESGHLIVEYDRALGLCLLNYAFTMKEDNEHRLQIFEEAFEQFNQLIENVSVSDLSHNDYNCRAVTLNHLGIGKNKKELLDESLADYDKALEIKKEGKKNILYNNRGILHMSRNNLQLALEDFISAEMEYSVQKQITNIEKIIKTDTVLLVQAIGKYIEMKELKKNIDNLEKVLKKVGSEFLDDYPEVAAALEKSELITSTDIVETQGGEI